MWHNPVMPFWYFFPVPELPREVAHQSGNVDLKRYLVAEGDSVDAGTPIAVIENYWAKMLLKANGKGIVMKTILKPGVTAKVGDPIATIGADGEDIPYRKPYAILEVIELKRRKP
jgi:pyruvate/2-oxoglutarate dehydrogenase complex dihydrolipoamide acyltransferase (E2) component